MNYQTFEPHADLASIVKCYWILEVPAQHDVQRQLIIPDGCMEMIFTLGDDVKRFTTGDDFIIQPRQMILGQITAPFYIQPTGYVNTFAVRFYPYGFSNFVTGTIQKLANRETPLAQVLGDEDSARLSDNILHAVDTSERIAIVEKFLLEKMTDEVLIDAVVKRTIDTMLSTKGSTSIHTLLKDDPSKRRQLERNFVKQIGVSPKQLGKVIRLQAALESLLSDHPGSLTEIAYDNDYYDQAHFIKDFKEFTGITPKAFLDDASMQLSSIFYKKS